MSTRAILRSDLISLPPPARYGVAVGAAFAAILLRLSLDPIWGLHLPFITLFPAIMLSAWLGGFWPGMLTTVLCAVAAEYFWVEPVRSWALASGAELIGLVVFLAVGTVISYLNETSRRTSAALAESEERLRVALTSIGDAVITTDMQGRVTRLNPVAEKLTGWSAAEAEGKPFHEVLVLVNERTGQPAENPVDRVLREGVVIGLANHTLLRSRDGREIPIDDSAAPMRSKHGHMTGVVMVFHDITERRRAEREQAALFEARAQLLLLEQDARTALERANRLKDEFLATLSHELRNPLNAVVGYVDLILSGILPPERTTRALQSIRQAAQAQTRLVQTLLDLSRIEAGKLELDRHALDLGAVLDAAADVVRPDAETKGITLNLVQPAFPISMDGDGGRLQQVFWNLLQNAVKFTERGGTITVHLTGGDSMARVEVSDDGEGIDPDFLPHIFDRFKQAGRQKTASSSGLGLGLALVRELVHAHGGSVVAASAGRGLGSTFTVTLPVSAGLLADSPDA